MGDKENIPVEEAVELCERFRSKKKVRLFSQCWGCMKYSKGDPEKMCFYDPPSNRGCKKVNREFDSNVK